MHGSSILTPEVRELAGILEGSWAAMAETLTGPVNVNYDNIITRTDAQALMPEEVSNSMLKGLESTSAVRATFQPVPVGRAQVRFPVLSALPVAYWVTGDTGLKGTTEVNWDNKFLNIEEIAVIIPIPENVLDDSAVPIWSQVEDLCTQAAGRTLDSTVFFGVNAPASFPDDIVTAIAGVTGGPNSETLGTSTAAEGGIVGDQGAMLELVEAQGYDLSSGVAARTFKGQARKARNTLGDRFGEITIGRDEVDVDGVTYSLNSMRGLWPTASGSAQAIAYDATEFVVGVRDDITWKLLDQAVIQGPDGQILYNLAQQDMVAMRMTLRIGWQVANTINYDQPDEDSRYPAGALLKA